MTSKKAPKLHRSLAFSVLLHALILGIMAIGAYTYTSSLSGDNGKSMNAIMVDRSIISEQNQRKLKQQAALDQRNRQRDAQAKAKAELLERQRQAEQQQLKELERKRLAALKAQKAQLAAAKAAELEKKRAQEIARKAKAEKEKAIADAAQAKSRAEALKRKAAEDIAKAEAEKAKAAELDEILGDLTSEQPARQEGVKHSEMAHYISSVQNAISSKFRNLGIYDGQKCILKISIAQDGMLVDVQSENDSLLCREAESATKLATLPKPTSEALYKKLKHFTLEFNPQKK